MAINFPDAPNLNDEYTDGNGQIWYVTHVAPVRWQRLGLPTVSGIPVGGTDDQILRKTSGVSYATAWENSGMPTGGTAGQVLSKIDGTSYNTVWSDGGGGGLTWQRALSAASPVLMVEGNGYLVESDLGIITMTLPAAPSVGDEIAVVDATSSAETNNITIARNGNKIMGLTEDMVIEIDHQGFKLVYSDAATGYGWVIASTAGGGDGITLLDQIGDVTIAAPANTEVLTYSAGAWGNAVIPAAGTGSIGQTEIGAGAVGQGELISTTSEVSHFGAQAILTLPGGEYGFYPRLRYPSVVGAALYTVSIFSKEMDATFLSTTYISMAGGTASFPLYAGQRYIQASPPYDLGDGEAGLFVFAVVDNSTGDVVSTYTSEEPPWALNGPTDIAGLPAAQKNADMAGIPHPFIGNDLTGKTVVMLDPISAASNDFLARAKSGESISEMLHNKNILIDNVPRTDRTNPPGVLSYNMRLV